MLPWCRCSSLLEKPASFEALQPSNKYNHKKRGSYVIRGITESQIDQLATFLCHSPTTHKEFYILPELTHQTAKISQFLMGINSCKPLTAENSSATQPPHPVPDESEKAEESGASTSCTSANKNVKITEENQ